MRAITARDLDLDDTRPARDLDLDDTRPARPRRRPGRQTARRAAIAESIGVQRARTAGLARIAA
ncbi:hypothetical protein [Catenuloplanes indicus]|uniref:Uncharacterized protein n=1 Tax=Catenuloplanes indicus TaxID=137267 RepID=A0AAE3VSD4_9ACTN|nr:hypothetical protein [Catenuloplanes indicus]MDQ0363373.1 hypothetical protein [Catenuloplanes indicus]MDQ0371695.1 hypothetical protein [Catenuloplanes indicus]